MMRMNCFILLFLPSLLCIEEAAKKNLCKIGDSEIDDGVWYQGQCVDPYQDGVCGEEALGQRLYVGEDGEVKCDCDEGWLRVDERCHQEFSSELCSDNKILNLGSLTKRRQRLKDGETYNCQRNPCDSPDLPNSLPHSLSWKSEKYCHDISALPTLEDCEMCPTNPYIDLSPMSCCKPANRTSCCQHSLLELPSVIIRKRGCPSGQVFSNYRRRCIRLY